MSTTLPDTRADIEDEIRIMGDELRDHVTDQNDGYDDHTPNIPELMRRLRLLEKRIEAFDTYGVDSMEALKADPVFERDNLLFRAMHSVEDAAQRWSDRRKRGLTDVELIEAFDQEAGRGCSGYSGVEGWYSCRMGQFTWMREYGKPEKKLTGGALARVLRGVLKMPQRVDGSEAAVEQLSLFMEPAHA